MITSKIPTFCLLVLCLLVSSASNMLLGQEAPFFSGSVWFSVEYSGPMAKDLQLNEPNTKALMHINENNYVVLLSGGRYPKTFMFIADSNYEYSVDARNKVAYRYSLYADLNKEKTQNPVVAKPTGKQLNVQGIICDEYRMPVKDGYMLLYVNDAYRVDVGSYPENARSKAKWLIPGLDGRIPLKTVQVLEKLNIITTCTKITERGFKESQFMIPPNFKVSGRDRRF